MNNFKSANGIYFIKNNNMLVNANKQTDVRIGGT